MPLDAERDWPAPIDITEETVTFDVEGARMLEVYRVAGGGNTEIAEEHAGKIDDLQTAVKALVDAGKGQRLIADMRLEILEEERRHHFWERLAYYAGMVFVIIGAVVL